jgi:hypothetical protein
MFNLYKGEQRMNRISGIKLLVALASICLVTATAANAVDYPIDMRLVTTTDGGATWVDVSTYSGPATALTIGVQVRSRYIYATSGGNEYFGSVTQYGFTLKDSTGIITPPSILEPVQSIDEFDEPTGRWASTHLAVYATSAPGYVNNTPPAGIFAGGSYDVFTEFGQMAAFPHALSSDGYTYGGGKFTAGTRTEGDWLTVAWGNVVYKGGNGTLSLLAVPSGQGVYKGSNTVIPVTMVNGVGGTAPVLADTILFGATTNHPPKMDSVMTGGHAGPFTKDDWSQEAGWNNTQHTMAITAAGNDSDDSPQNLPLTFNWSITDGRTGGLTKNLTDDGHGAVYNLTIAELANLWGVANLPQNPTEAATLWMLHVAPVDSLGLAGAAMDVGVYVPEPATIGLLAFGIVGLLRRRRA